MVMSTRPVWSSRQMNSVVRPLRTGGRARATTIPATFTFALSGYSSSRAVGITPCRAVSSTHGAKGFSSVLIPSRCRSSCSRWYGVISSPKTREDSSSWGSSRGEGKGGPHPPILPPLPPSLKGGGGEVCRCSAR